MVRGEATSELRPRRVGVGMGMGMAVLASTVGDLQDHHGAQDARPATRPPEGPGRRARRRFAAAPFTGDLLGQLAGRYAERGMTIEHRWYG